jgi:hypothetical protein
MSNGTLDFDFQDHLEFSFSGIYGIPLCSAQNQIQQLLRLYHALPNIFLPPNGRKKDIGLLGESVAKESWPRRHKADGGQAPMPRQDRGGWIAKRDPHLFDEPPVGLAPAEAELVSY